MIFVWTLGDVLAVVFGFLFAVVMLFFWIGHSLNEWKCKHRSGVRETSACDAICVQCGKNLGFIGEWLKHHPADRRSAK